MAWGSSKTWWQRLVPWVSLAALVVLIDQLTKIVIERSFSFGEVRPITSFFNLVLTYNKGAAFSFLANASGETLRGAHLSGLASNYNHSQ